MGCGTANRVISNTKLADQTSNEPKAFEFPTVVIYYGSQTGNSERLAKELLKDARERYKFNASYAGLEKFDATTLVMKELIVFVVSTYVEGGPTDNAQKFYQWLTNTPLLSVEGLRFAVFGCGDSRFGATFNRMAKVTESLLVERGAEKVFETGLGDDSRDLNVDFSLWRAKLWPALIEFYEKEQGVGRVAQGNSMQSAKFTISFNSELEKKVPIADYSVNAKQFLISRTLAL